MKNENTERSKIKILAFYVKSCTLRSFHRQIHKLDLINQYLKISGMKNIDLSDCNYGIITL